MRATPQAGEAGHQVQLTGPDVAQRERVERDTCFAEAEVALVDRWVTRS